ncbi:MAG: type II toxin-antitoxin system RelE/ParE family toxin [Alphaproteobacteria bacterium]|nr:type II toxin-antitoxin system RelE/ParE family toxin [Alphaproteobacteria bacterium]
MIKSIKHKGLKELYEEGSTRRINRIHIGKCIMILNALEVAKQPQDLNIQGFAFHGLEGKPKRYSVKVNKNYRVTYGWDNDGAAAIDFEDYH